MRLLFLAVCLCLCMGCAPPEGTILLDVPVELYSETEFFSEPDQKPKEEELGTVSTIQSTETKPKKLIIQYSISACVWCKFDRDKIFPEWRKLGYNFAEPVDETARPSGIYPRYEIYDANGVIIRHSGSLSAYKGKK